MRQDSKARLLAAQGLIAAVYTVLSLTLPMWSFGAVQVRFAEALTLLPVFSATSIWGVTLGCFLTNLIGVFLGANILGILDVAVGTAATLAATLATRALRNLRVGKLPLAAALPPVVINAGAIGAELTFVGAGGFSAPLFWSMAGTVALGQAAACLLLGLPMVCFLEKRGWGRYL